MEGLHVSFIENIVKEAIPQLKPKQNLTQLNLAGSEHCKAAKAETVYGYIKQAKCMFMAIRLNYNRGLYPQELQLATLMQLYDLEVERQNELAYLHLPHQRIESALQVSTMDQPASVEQLYQGQEQVSFLSDSQKNSLDTLFFKTGRAWVEYINVRKVVGKSDNKCYQNGKDYMLKGHCIQWLGQTPAKRGPIPSSMICHSVCLK